MLGVLPKVLVSQAQRVIVKQLTANENTFQGLNTINLIEMMNNLIYRIDLDAGVLQAVATV